MKIKYFLLPAGAALACCLLALAVNRTAMSCDTKPSTARPPSTAPAAAQHAPRPIPDDLQDLPFDRFVDLYLLGRAWGNVDPVLLADCGLQLAEGERVLLRQHKALPAERVLAMAVKAAADRHDMATLDRLAKGAERDGLKVLASKIAVARKLAGAARAEDSTATVGVEEMTVNAYAAYKGWLLSLRAARLAGDGETLTKLDSLLPSLAGISNERKDALKKKITEARAALPQKTDSDAIALARALSRLHAVSRGCDPDNPLMCGWF